MGDHSHLHTQTSKKLNNAFVIGITLNILFVVIEAIAGFITNSLSLLSDAGHNLADVGTLALSLLAFRLVKIRSSEKYTYGYRKSSVLVTLLNALILFASVGAISYEAFHRFIKPEPLAGDTIAMVAGIGILVNGLSAFLFFGEKDRDLNVKGAYLHLLGDALVSLAVLLGGIIMYYTRWYRIDAFLSLVVVAVIIYNTWNLLRDSLRLSLDGVPSDISVHEIREAALSVEGVKAIHHIHLWGISTTENAVTAHIVLADNTTQVQEDAIKRNLKHLWEHKNIHHITIETERENTSCDKEDC